MKSIEIEYIHTKCSLCIEDKNKKGRNLPCCSQFICEECFLSLQNINCPFCRTNLNNYSVNKTIYKCQYSNTFFIFLKMIGLFIIIMNFIEIVMVLHKCVNKKCFYKKSKENDEEYKNIPRCLCSMEIMQAPLIFFNTIFYIVICTYRIDYFRYIHLPILPGIVYIISSIFQEDLIFLNSYVFYTLLVHVVSLLYVVIFRFLLPLLISKENIVHNYIIPIPNPNGI